MCAHFIQSKKSWKKKVLVKKNKIYKNDRTAKNEMNYKQIA